MRAIVYGVAGVSALALAFAIWRAQEEVNATAHHPLGSGGGSRVLGAVLVPVRGSTYFAAVMTHGSANVATASMVVDYARSHGFVDVVVSTSPIPGWPPLPSADFYVRGTYAGEASQSFPRHKGVALGSVDVLDVWAV